MHYWAAHHPGDTVSVLDVLTYAGNPANLAGLNSVDLVVGDICDTDLVEKLLAERDIDTIVHFAAESHVDRSITGPDAFVTTNVIGTHSLLKGRAQALARYRHRQAAPLPSCLDRRGLWLARSGGSGVQRDQAI